MDKNLTALKPALVWKHFAEIAKIPRPSSHEEKIRAYVIGVAKSLGLECKEDAAHNVYVRKPASKGMENRKGIVLQAHLDIDRKSTRLNSSHIEESRMPSSA